MRLVDAEDLKARAREEIGGMEEPLASQFAILVEWLVDKTATAYDVEKVVEQIHNCFCKVIDACEEDIIPQEILEYNKSICEIVRSGGVE